MRAQYCMSWTNENAGYKAELGGALSLFLGVSLLSAWDCGEFLVDKYKHRGE